MRMTRTTQIVTTTMGRRRKPPPGARALNGWLVLDKPAGISSARAVALVRAALKPLRIGHAGTLDPLATGILPMALGEATKTIAYAMNGTKAYRFTLHFGEARTTDDAEGTVIATSAIRPATADIEAILPRFIGQIAQVPPVFSAIKMAGQRAYALARAGKPPEMAERIIEINDLKLISRPDPETAEFTVVCAKGTYIRALGRDLAEALGTVGYVLALRRTQVGPFCEIHAIGLDKLDALGHSARAFEPLLPIETVLDDIPALALSGDEAALIRQGRAVKVLGTGGSRPREGNADVSAELSDGTVVCAMDGTRLVALARYVAGEIHPVRVLNL
ncbi:MAG: tRNA pseudouridine55 synthase [Alphaproteobacteria bacterium]|jgi:tRNA pseudouridine55 synthase